MKRELELLGGQVGHDGFLEGVEEVVLLSSAGAVEELGGTAEGEGGEVLHQKE
jgi:hypothetical protein